MARERRRKESRTRSGVAFAGGEDAEGAGQQEVLLGGGFFLLDDEAVGGFEEDCAGGVAGVVVDDAFAVRRDRDGLGDDVEGAAGGELQVDVAEGFEAGAEAGRRTADALRDGADLAAGAGQERGDAVGFTQFLGAQHDRLIPVERHPVSLSPARRHTPRGRSARRPVMSSTAVVTVLSSPLAIAAYDVTQPATSQAGAPYASRER